jgi:hypothetical protein
MFGCSCFSERAVPGVPVRRQSGHNQAASLLRRRHAAPRERQSYPQPGYVAVVSGDAQEWEFISSKVIGQPGDLPVLGTERERWLSQAEATALLGELAALAATDVSATDRLDILRAPALVRYGVDTGTGIQVVPSA